MTDRTASKVTLDDCPPGLFWFDGTLGFKSEYAQMKHEDFRPVGLQCDAYVVSSGEYFWGGTSDWKERGKLLVTPLDLDEQGEAFWMPFSYTPKIEG